ncbi:beta-ketoacyl-[acyl-carrier-protein] synthase family protein [Neorhodopirellula lusitana]|uniref:beta-ketoacyl-[acyl-carrier-protein] synthase family protein n=1 Tax=Neorhodopirellula lusitana TaxID=445327 RepID=UPI0038502D91
MKPTDLVISGVGMVSAIGIGREPFSKSLMSGCSGVVKLDDVDPQSAEQAGMEHLCRQYALVDGEAVLDERTAVAAPIVDFDGKQFVKPRKALKVMCREIQTAYAASSLAISDAQLDGYLPAVSPDEADYEDGGKIANVRIGTVFGSEMLYGPPSELADAFAACIGANGNVDTNRFGGAAVRGITPLWLLKYLPNMPACHVGIVAGAHGPNNTVTVGDTSGPAAFMEGCGYMTRDIADFMIVSAAGSRLNATRALFTEDQPLASVYEPASRSSRPHASDADGFVRGEGAAGLVLERGSTAKARGRKPIAKVLGYASRFIPSSSFKSGERNAEIRPDAGRGSTAAIVAAMRGALQMAGVSADELGAVIGHGFGDPVIDACEREAINEVAADVPVALPASVLGHTSAASGMMGLVSACVVLQANQIPPVEYSKACHAGLNVDDQPRDLTKPFVMAIAHTSPGNATAILLGR